MATLKEFTLSRRLVAEMIGTAFLVAAVIGSGIMGEQLASGNMGIALLANTMATGAMLIVIILMFGAISGAHFNPVVSLSFASQYELPWKDFLFYIIAQCAGGVVGAMLAHIMFDLPLIMESTHARTGIGIWMGELVASFALLLTILMCNQAKPEAVPYAVAMIIMAGYWFTSSTSFANPAVTLARALSDTFVGIRPEDVPAFIIIQVIGAVLATNIFRWFYFPSDNLS